MHTSIFLSSGFLVEFCPDKSKARSAIDFTHLILCNTRQGYDRLFTNRGLTEALSMARRQTLQGTCDGTENNLNWEGKMSLLKSFGTVEFYK
jgi:hypothetical protein